MSNDRSIVFAKIRQESVGMESGKQVLFNCLSVVHFIEL